MYKKRQQIEARWLGSRVPAQRTGNEAIKFADECWNNNLRLAKCPRTHYELVMAYIRSLLIS